MSDWFEGEGGGAGVDVMAMLDGLHVMEHFGSLVALGALVAMGTTRDGGALGVTITVDGRWRREYFRDGAELEAWLLSAIKPVEAAVEAARASSVAESRGRRRRGL